MFGDAEAVEQKVCYEQTVKCRSLTGEVYTIPLEHFCKRVLVDSDTLGLLYESAMQKRRFLAGRILSIRCSRIAEGEGVTRRPVLDGIKLDVRGIRDGTELLRSFDARHTKRDDSANLSLTMDGKTRKKLLETMQQGFPVIAARRDASPTAKRVLFPLQDREVEKIKRRRNCNRRAMRTYSSPFSPVRYCFKRPAATLGLSSSPQPHRSRATVAAAPVKFALQIRKLLTIS